jgi:predicted RND superfamily exporter protein
LKQNIARSGIVGSLVATNFKSSMIFVPLLEKEPGTGNRIDYHRLSHVLEEKIRARYELAKAGDAAVTGKATPNIRIHIIGFAKLIGELIDGLFKVMAFFGIAAVIATAVIYAYTRCVRSTALVVACSLVAVVWQLGLVALAGFELDPFSILVPFLVFAIGVSHGAQKMNGIMQDVGRGTHKLVAARYTFRRLFLAGLTALLADAVGFAVLMVIDIPVIQELALTASIGVAVLIFTNLLLLPVLAVIHRRQQGGSPAHAARGQGRSSRQGARSRVAAAGPFHHAALGACRRCRGRRACRRRLCRESPSQDRRPRSGSPGTAGRFALQPRQCLHHHQLRAVL